MSSTNYKKLGDSGRVQHAKDSKDYEYFQLFDPEDSDIELEPDSDVRNLLVAAQPAQGGRRHQNVDQRSLSHCCYLSWL